MIAQQTFHIKNFEKLQHYKDRSPPWIKLYNGLLDDYEFARLPDASKAHLLAIGLLASRYSNKIPLDAEWIARRINATCAIDLQALIKSGFIIPDQDCSNMLADCKQDARPERERERETQVRGREETEKKKERRAEVALPDWLPLEPWNSFLQSRKKVTPRASELLIRELSKFRDQGDDPKSVLEQSTMNGWRGLFPLKKVNGNGHGRESSHEQTERVARELIAEFNARDAARDHGGDRAAGNSLPSLLTHDAGIAARMDCDAVPGLSAQVPRRAAIRR